MIYTMIFRLEKKVVVVLNCKFKREEIEEKFQATKPRIINEQYKMFVENMLAKGIYIDKPLQFKDMDMAEEVTAISVREDFCESEKWLQIRNKEEMIIVNPDASCKKITRKHPLKAMLKAITDFFFW